MRPRRKDKKMPNMEATAIEAGSLVKHRVTDHVGFVEKIEVFRGDETTDACKILKVRWHSENKMFYYTHVDSLEVEHYHDFDVYV